MTEQRPESVKERMARLEARNAELEQQVAAKQGRLTFKVSPKKAMSIYGLGRFPVTLYKDQWLVLMDMEKEIRTYLDNHSSELA